jgi:DNA polymerase-3 subunit gamma/tau
MSYQVLARKWRPRDFSTLIGQDHVVRALTHALAGKRLHHAYLFTGTRGVGKTTLARILAKSLNCIGADGRGDITPQPCNVCEACTAIDAGRFVDYIEMDAASNRGVDEMVQLLERAMYAPGNARFKVYMIDEVHQLSNHAFNAMLKTLEEPPDYVKFILATTDPQKVPVTVLSRCLQFNLKQMTPGAIVTQMAGILQQEKIGAEPAALAVLAQAARGSMRDGLSLLDQAIAYSAGEVTLDAVRGMLGSIDPTTLVRIVDAVCAGDAPAALAVAEQMNEACLSFGEALRDLASLLHRVAIAQRIGAADDDDADAVDIARLARALAPEAVQLFYQIALHGRNDMHLAPDEYAGFTMTVLRMIAFDPQRTAGSSEPTRVAGPKASAPSTAARSGAPAGPAVRAPAKAVGFTGDWTALVSQLKVAGLVKELAQRSELVSANADHFRLRVPIRTLIEAGTIERLRTAISEAIGRPVRVSAEVGAAVGPTVASVAEQARGARQRQAEESIYGDPVVRELIDHFGAAVDPASIRPRIDPSNGSGNDNDPGRKP